ncbi:MAG: hypothetical protein LAP40_22205 [Acidobacteriia bacterium]|nr:hypothetical protein [Terriglobia bacterium]
MATILILNDDLGFALWLGQALSASTCEALPATTVSEAAALIGHFKLIIDLVIVNPRVPGAVDFTRTLRRAQGRLHVATLDSGTDAGSYGGNGWPFLTTCEI